MGKPRSVHRWATAPAVSFNAALRFLMAAPLVLASCSTHSLCSIGEHYSMSPARLSSM
ncbi:hypothetical protein [Kitasatospora sp. A2-31]|uniref:hypothetical protein n=1 Tax=Kitasatospora sp. A2-31 TaxID=2916414 RepID=UPI001EEA4754|nr:hypothetical protein [Kitasatospora sp. A2-31]MCG6496866.1 hypothetical protein [Kitasatospora sp. A2-31]